MQGIWLLLDSSSSSMEACSRAGTEGAWNSVVAVSVYWGQVHVIEQGWLGASNMAVLWTGHITFTLRKLSKNRKWDLGIASSVLSVTHVYQGGFM